MATATKTKPSKNGRARRPRQQQLPGMERQKNAKVEKLCEAWLDAVRDRMTCQDDEQDAYDLMEAAMVDAGLDSYETDTHIFFVSNTKRIKSKRKKENQPDTQTEEAASDA